jgi:hypothetical protein
MHSSEFARKFPRLFHVADRRAAGRIVRCGLLSVAALCEDLELRREHCEWLRTQRRTSMTRFETPDGMVVLRDQHAIHPAALEASLTDMTTVEWFEALSRRVFLFPTEGLMRPLLRSYRGACQVE